MLKNRLIDLYKTELIELAVSAKLHTRVDKNLDNCHKHVRQHRIKPVF